MQPSLNKTTLYNVVNIIGSLMTQTLPLWRVKFNYHSMYFCYPFNGQEPTMWTVNDCLRIMVCWCIIQCKGVLIPVVFNCWCVIVNMSILIFLTETGKQHREKVFVVATFCLFSDVFCLYLRLLREWLWLTLNGIYNTLGCLSLTSHGSE